MVAEEVVVSISGGAPWGFRLQGGAEQKQPLQVAKVRKRSKACRAGLREADELVAINDVFCNQLSHAEAMNLIDNGRGTLHLKIKRAPVGFPSVVLMDRAPSPRIDKEYRAALRGLSPPINPKALMQRPSLMSPTGGPRCLTSPPDSEAYYGETDSDADVATQERQRKQKRRSPAGSPGKHAGRISPSLDDNSEMSGYESTSDISTDTVNQSWSIPNGKPGGMGLLQQQGLPGVTRREVVYRPNQGDWSVQGENFSESSDHSPSAAAEVDSGFQEPPTVPPPLVSPERAREALMRASYSKLVPMVGPVNNPVDDELTVTYMDKAKQAKLHKSETVQDKQVKEARFKCRTIASLLTDAPNPHSKGVLMFKKRRQRAKRYTLTCFGSADTDSYINTEGETEDESFFTGSESEMDEDSLSAVPDPTWDSEYLDVLEKRTSACVLSDKQTNGILSATSGKGAQLFEQQRKKAEKHTSNTVHPTLSTMPQQKPETIQIYTHVNSIAPFSPHSTDMVNGDALLVSKTNVVLSSPVQTPMPTISGNLPEQSDSSAGCVLNRTAKPFAPGCVSHRAATAPVNFKPNTVKKTSPQTQTMSVTSLPVSFSPSLPAGKKIIASSSLYIPPRPATVTCPTSILSPSSSVASTPFSPISSTLMPFSSDNSQTADFFSPHAPAQAVDPAQGMRNQAFSSPQTQNLPFCPHPNMTKAPNQSSNTTSAQSFVSTCTPSSNTLSNSAPNPVQEPVNVSQEANTQPSTSHKVSFNPIISVATTTYDNVVTPIAQQYPLSDSSGGICSREQRISVPAARTGILQEARRRGSKKPMFTKPEEKKPVTYNPALLSLVQNLDDNRPGVEPGFESGPEEDFLNLGAEACNFMQAHKSKMPPAIAPKPVQNTFEIPQMGGKGADLFARRQSRMDRYVVDKTPRSPAQLREPSPTPSLQSHWKYSPNVRAPPPISYNPLLSPSCPPVAQRSSKTNEASRSGMKTATGQNKQGIKALDFLSRQPYQLNSSLFSYGGGTPQTVSTYQQMQHPQHQNGIGTVGRTLNPPKQVKAPRVYEIKRFSTPTPMSEPTVLSPTVIVPRSSTTLAEPMWRCDTDSPPSFNERPAAPFFSPPQPFIQQPAAPFSSPPPAVTQRPVAPFSPPPAPRPTVTFSSAPPSVSPRPAVTFSPAPPPVAQRPAVTFSPPPPAPTGALPALPKLSIAPVSDTVHIPAPVHMQAHTPFQAGKQFKSAPDISPLSPNGLQSVMSGSSQNLQVPRPRFSASSIGLQPNVWRPGAKLY